MELTIVTNRQWRTFMYGYELPAKWRKEYDYLSDEEYDTMSFCSYRGWLYSVDSFMRIPSGMFPKPWNGYLSDTFFSGVVIEISDDGEMYRIGRYYS